MAPPPLFLTDFAVGLSGAMMPGPISTITLAQSVKRGVRAGPLITTGHALMEGLLVVALAFGLGGPLRWLEIIATVRLELR